MGAELLQRVMQRRTERKKESESELRRIHRRRMKNILAVSTVIANMMMITITLGLAAILIAWTGSTYGLFAGGAQIFYQQRGQALEERFVVEDVFSNTTVTPMQLLVFVRNVGVEQINVVAIYVNGICLPSTIYGTNQENCSAHRTPLALTLPIAYQWGACLATLVSTFSIYQVR